jgi:hypothetical protein
MAAKYLWVLGSVLITLLGLIHLYYTFFTRAFSSENEKMIQEMKTSSPLLTQKITMWNAWIGFNGSHSGGLLFIGITNLYLALSYFGVLQSDHFYFIFTILTIGFYLYLAEKYWFNIPLMVLSIALVCFVGAYLLTLLTK